jgi:hypothetical protein
VGWIDDLDSRVDIIATALADLRGMARLGIGFARGSVHVPRLRGPAPGGSSPPPGRGLRLQVTRFTVIGVASTVAYLVLFVLLRVIMPAQAANVVSLLATAATVLRFLLYRHWAFGRHRVSGRRRESGPPERAEVTAWPSPGPAIGTVEMATQGERSS